MKEFSYTVQDALGIHARPAGLLVKEAAKFPCDITLKCGEKKGSAKKIMAVMAMGVKKDICKIVLKQQKTGISGY